MQLAMGRKALAFVASSGKEDIARLKALRQMARMKIYPDRMRLEFLAEAASILSGYPPERFMPSESLCPLFQ